jgi:hypothetical protein
MFDKMTVKELRALISKYKAHHNIKGYHDMKKSKLVAELHKRFEIKEGKMYLKTDAGSVVVADEIVIKRPKSAMEKARKLRAMLEEDVVEPEIIVKRPQSALAKARKRRALLEGDEPVAVVKEKRRIVPTLISPAVAPPVAVVKEKRRIVPTLISSPPVAVVREKRRVVPTLISSPAPVAVARKKSKKKKKYASPGLKTWEKATNKLYEKYKHASEDMHPDLALSVKSKKKGKKKK